MKVKLTAILFLCLWQISFGQQQYLSPKAEISILTVGPGTALNDAFGHSGFRIKDTTGLDVVFNYGVYDFNAPNFYLKFARGKLEYLIGANYFDDFYQSYLRQNRTIDEQVLQLSTREKQTLYNYLLHNYKPENRRYTYDFFYNNCATKIREVLERNTENRLLFRPYEGYEEKTFRTLIQDKLHWNSWGSLGIDLALGASIDRITTPEEHMFLPENIYRFFAEATFSHGIPLVKATQNLYTQKQPLQAAIHWANPLTILSLLALFIIYITYTDYKNNTRTRWLDVLLGYTTGTIGLCLFLLWFATDHTATGYNYNMLWAFPVNIFIAHTLLKKQPKPWVKSYIKFLLLLLCLMVFHWLMGVQVFAPALLPLLLALAIRYVFLLRITG